MFTTVQAWVGRAARPFTRASDSALAHERLRFYTLLAIAGLKLFNLFGSIWDIQWHASIGRDTFWIPPHIVAIAGFVSALALALAAVTYETWLDRRGMRMQGVARVGGITTSPYFLSIALSYLAGIFFAFLDDQWHRAFGLDVTLWSPPHLLIGLAMAGVDFSLLLGLVASAKRQGLRFKWRGAYLWGFVLLGAFMFESANYWTSQAFIYGYSHGGAGLLGLLFPLLVGALYPLALVLNLRLAKAYWIVVPIFVATLLLQYTGTGLATLGFAAVKPASLLEGFIRENPESTVALARQFTLENGMSGLIGLQQAWVMWLSGIPLFLVALLSFVPAARGRWLIAAPLYSVSVVLTCYIWFQRLPVMAKYDVTWGHVALAVLLAAAGGLVLGWLGSKLAGVVDGAPVNGGPVNGA
jgi:MFS family permease